MSPDRFENYTLMSEIGPTSSPKASRKFEFKKSPVKQRKAKTDVRVFTLGQFKERERNKGCYLHVDLEGTDFPIQKDDQFLETKGLKLTDEEKYELCWNHAAGVHVARTKSKRHFHLICDLI